MRMIIVPNNKARIALHEKHPSETILTLNEYAERLLDQTNLLVATKLQCRYLLMQCTEELPSSNLLSHISFLYKQCIDPKILLNSQHPNTARLGRILEGFSALLMTHQFVHASDMLNQLRKQHLDLIYQPIYYYGFYEASPSEQLFFNHFKILPREAEPQPSIHKHQFFDTLDEEIIAARNWQQAGDDRKIIALSAEYHEALAHHLEPVQTCKSQHQYLQMITGITHPFPYLPTNLINFLISSQQYPKGLSLLSFMTKQSIPRTIKIDFCHGFSYRFQPLLQSPKPINSSQAIDCIKDILLFWELDATHPHFQAVTHALSELASLSVFNVSVPYHTWHAWFQECLKPNSAIESVMSYQGTRIKSLWILGANTENWQQNTQLTVLPPELRATEHFDFLHQSADEIIYSSQKSNTLGDKLSLPTRLQSHLLELSTQTSSLIETVITEQTLPLDAVYKSGVSIIEDYATCPFKAFSRHRLKLKARQRDCFELPPNQWGSIVHLALETLYQTINTQSDLNKASEEKLLNTCHQTLIKFDPLPAQLKPMIEKRLLHTLKEWIETDKKRPDFTIHRLESRHTLQLEKHQFNIRIDRIDQQNNQPVLIDYKTGGVSIKDAFHPHLTHPQMPMYALTQSTLPILAYGKLKAQQASYQSVDLGCQNSIAKYHPPDGLSDQNLLSQWKAQATLILNRYCAGLYPVSPINPNACNQCDFQSLCRIYDTGDSHDH